jgi:PPOX class probable F420-dependent enzyme
MTMTREAIEDFLTTPNRHAIVGTNRLDGAPQLSPVWYVYENGRMYISVPDGSVKHQNLKRDPRVAICVDGGRQDVRAVMLYGAVEIKDRNAAATQEMRWRIVRAYYPTEDAARQYYETVQDTPSVLLVLEPEKIVSQDYND